jgi:hypothetical protein
MFNTFINIGNYKQIVFLTKATMHVRGELTDITITQVLHVPKMKNSLISMSKLIFEGFKVEFNKDGCKVNDAQGVVMAEA